MEESRIEISRELLDAVRALAEEQDRPGSEVLEEAVLRYLYLRERLPVRPSGDSANVGEELEELFERVDRGQRERDVEPLSEEEAMRLADEELHAMRRDQRSGR